MTAVHESEGQSPLYPIHCRGCGQTMGWGAFQQSRRSGPTGHIYCSLVCAYDGPLRADASEERNDLIRNVVAAGWTISETAEYFGLSRQRVEQVLAR